MSDGTNDIILQKRNQTKMQLVNLLLTSESGDYFNGINHQRPGEIKQGLGIEYWKTSSWSLSPVRKGPVPEGLNYQPIGETFMNEIFSIDGEKYPA